MRLCADSSRCARVAQSGSPNGSSDSASGTAPGAPMRGMPPTVTCEPLAPSRRCVNASITWLPTVRPNRTIHAPGMWSELLMVPVAVPSSRYAPEAFESASVSVSEPSSCASSSTATETVFSVSPAAKVSVPDAAV